MPIVSSGGFGISESAQRLTVYQDEIGSQFVNQSLFDFINGTDMKWIG